MDTLKSCNYRECYKKQLAQGISFIEKGEVNFPKLSDECEVFVGGTVTNVIPTYKPNALRKNNEWKSVQELKLSTYIRTSSTWNDVGTEQVATIGQVNKGHTRRRQGGEWKQERPFA